MNAPPFSAANMKSAHTAILGAMAAALLAGGCEQAPVGLQQKYGCTSCHALDRKLVGPAFQEVAEKYRGNQNAEAVLMAKVRSGGAGVWGPLAMPPNGSVPDEDLRQMIRTILATPAR